jgi:hypothetical protein
MTTNETRLMNRVAILEDALRDILCVLHQWEAVPSHAERHCEGCDYEIREAGRVAREAIPKLVRAEMEARTRRRGIPATVASPIPHNDTPLLMACGHAEKHHSFRSICDVCEAEKAGGERGAG